VLDDMERSRRWIHGDAPRPGDAEGSDPRVRVEPGASAGGVRVDDGEPEPEIADETDEDRAHEPRSRGRGRRGP